VVSNVGEPQRAVGTRSNALGFADTGRELAERSVYREPAYPGSLGRAVRKFGEPQCTVGADRNVKRRAASRQSVHGHQTRRGDTHNSIRLDLRYPQVAVWT